MLSLLIARAPAGSRRGPEMARILTRFQTHSKASAARLAPVLASGLARQRRSSVRRCATPGLTFAARRSSASHNTVRQLILWYGARRRRAGDRSRRPASNRQDKKMARMKGADLITEHLVRNKIPYVFGICGHGNVGMLEFALRRARQDQAGLAAARAGRRAHGGCLFPRAPRAGRDADLLRPRLRQYRDAAAGGAVGLLRAARDHRERADPAVQPLAVPGGQPPLPGRHGQRAAPGGETRVPADARRHAAARAAPGDHHDAVGPSGAGERRRAVQRVPGGRRRRGAAGLAAARHPAQRRIAG